MKNFLFSIILTTFIFNLSFSQILPVEKEPKSIHQIESEYYHLHPEEVGKEPLAKPTLREDLMKVESMSKLVYGFHPYWISDATAGTYYYSLLSHVVYFSCEVDTNGNFSTTRNWATTQLVNYARMFGKKIHLCITFFDDHSTVLHNSAKRAQLINNIITQMNVRSADGINIDFESMSTSVADSFRTFIVALGDSLMALGKELVVELPSVDWGGVVFNSTFFAATSPRVTYYFMMAYAYWWKRSPTAGPLAPLSTGTSFWHVTRSIRAFIDKGCPASKLIAGFGYYGFDWPVVSNVRCAATTANGSSIRYYVAKEKAATLPVEDKFFDAQYNSPWYRYQTALWHQAWYEDSLSLAMKYDSVKALNIVGTGMWALGYDGVYSELWGALKTAFASKTDSRFTVIEDFETSMGRFDKPPSYSGSTVGISKNSPSSRTVGYAYNGQASLWIVLKDSTQITTPWTVRLLCNGGSRTGNQPITNSGYVGFWMRTTTAPTGAQVALTIDDRSGETELSSKLNVINDGQWHLYQYNLTGSDWTSFSGGNGQLDSTTLSLDAIMLYAPNTENDWTIYVDDVCCRADGPLLVQIAEQPLSFDLYQNYPNPFNPRTVISYHLPVSQAGLSAVSLVLLKVYDVLGREVAILQNGLQNPGNHSVQFNASHLPSGVYIYSLEVGGKRLSRRMVVIR